MVGGGAAAAIIKGVCLCYHFREIEVNGCKLLQMHLLECALKY
jgi:hypothetical protein